MIRFLPMLATALLVTACGGAPTPSTGPVAATATDASVTAAYAESVSRIGDVTIRASVMQTSMLNATVAAQYGIRRDDTQLMLLVGVRQGPQAQDIALPATITATATDLRGQKQDIAMRELRTGELLDYVGTLDISLPDTIRFDVTIVREGGATSTMQLTREFYPR